MMMKYGAFFKDLYYKSTVMKANTDILNFCVIINY